MSEQCAFVTPGMPTELKTPIASDSSTAPEAAPEARCRETGIVRPGVHYTALDGIRGLSIIGVLLFHFYGHYHALAAALPGPLALICRLGQTGVDCFFVLSGFLITGILVDTRHRAHRYRTFYARRALRIFPVYFLTVLVVYNLIPDLLGTRGLAPYQIWLWTYTQNIGSTFNWCPNFGHFWSLAVEEQFYLLWPPLVWLARSPKNVGWLCLATILLAFCTRAAFALYGMYPAQFTLCRIDELALGGLLAVLGRQITSRSIWKRVSLGIASLVLAIGATLYLLKNGSGAAVIQVVKYDIRGGLFAGLIALAVRAGAVPTAGWTRLLLARPLLWCGHYSYALYLFHPFVMSACDKVPAGTSPVAAETCRVALTLSLTLTLAWLSWRFLEAPCLSLKKHFPS